MRVKAGRIHDIEDGRGRVVEVGGREIALFRKGERVYALDNVCPHRGAALAFGDVREDTVFCPLHAWPFQLETGECPEFPDVCVQAFDVRVEGGDVVMEL